MNVLEPFLDWQEDMQLVRRDLHAYPELAFNEHRTSDRVAELLQQWGIEVHRGLGGTGVVGILRGDGPQELAIGLRADMDALPMQETNTFAHASKNGGLMHGCGHDGHTTMLLNASRYLSQNRQGLGTVYLIFQPAEEGGNAGARKMIEDGLFERFPMDAVFGMHNWPGLAVGQFGVTPGAIMASSNLFTITIEGKGAHAGMPQLGADPIMAAVQVTQALQSIITRNRHPLESAVLSITQIHAGSAMNVIPSTAQILGTVRTFSATTLDLIEQRMGQIVESVSKAMQCQGELDFARKYPPTVNDESAAFLCVEVMHEIVGAANVFDRVTPTMAAEDFAFMLERVPGCYVWIGNGDGEHRDLGHGMGPCALHNGSYDFNDELLPIGATYWVKLAQRWFAQAKLR